MLSGNPTNLPTAWSGRAPSGPVAISAATVREELERKAQVRASPPVGKLWSSVEAMKSEPGVLAGRHHTRA